MRILLINDPGIPVPPQFYGGIERIVYQLAEELIKNGHEVTLLSGPQSGCSGKTITFGKNGSGKTRIQTLKEVAWVWNFLRCNQNNFDIVHSFGRLIYLMPILNRSIKKLMSYQREVTLRNINTINKFPNKNLHFTGCSNYITQAKGNNWSTVYNFVNITAFDFQDTVEANAPMVFLGRLDSIKGCHHCIALAKKLGHPLVIAGNISDLAHERDYFERDIKPHIDGNLIKYIGPVDDKTKNELLRKSKVLLMLIDWDEPFGIVMAEAMACGTPVIGFNRGAIPEVVVNGLNGYRVNSIDEAAEAVGELGRISRLKVRRYCEENFGLDVILKDYLYLYENIGNTTPSS